VVSASCTNALLSPILCAVTGARLSTLLMRLPYLPYADALVCENGEWLRLYFTFHVLRVCMCACVRACVCLYMWVCGWVCVCVFVCACVYMCMRVFVQGEEVEVALIAS